MWYLIVYSRVLDDDKFDFLLWYLNLMELREGVFRNREICGFEVFDIKD